VTQTASGVPKVGVSATVSDLGGATFNPTATGLAAASGFGATSTATSGTGSKKNAGVSGPRPFQWSAVVVGIISVLGMGIGGGLFAIL